MQAQEQYHANVISGVPEDESELQRTSVAHPSSSSSAIASTSRLAVTPSAEQIAQANHDLANAEPQEILAWAIQHIPNLYQTTAFGLTGLAALDMISKLSPPGNHLVPLIFINTLYHFPETLNLAAEASQKYGAQMHVYMPPAAMSVDQFEQIYGQRLWEVDEESYDYLVKVGHVGTLLCLDGHTTVLTCIHTCGSATG